MDDDHVWEIRSIDTCCPCQGEGWVLDPVTKTRREWFFRARHEHWSFEVYAEGDGGKAVFEIVAGPWGAGGHEAGFMPHDSAQLLILAALHLYRASCTLEGVGLQRGKPHVPRS